MNKPLNKTGDMFKTLLKRDWLKLIIWVLAVLAFAASGVGKFEVLLNAGNKVAQLQEQATIYSMFNNPAMVGLFGPTFIKNPVNYNIGALFGQTMTLMTALVFSIVAIIYAINRTRKEEDDGVAELFRSFQIGKLANTTAVVIELFILQLVITLALALSIQAQQVPTMMNFSQNILYASSIGAQGFLWGMIALLFSQLFPEAGSAKGATFGLLGILYVIRMGTDIKAIHLSWLNPLSWSYLTNVYVKGNWLPLILTLVLSIVFLIVAYLLESRRDINAGFVSVRNGRARASKSLLSIPGLVLRQQRAAIIGWLFSLFVLGCVYGSMFSQIGQFVAGNSMVSQMIAVSPKDGEELMIQQYLAMLFLVLSIIVTCFAITSLSRMVSEERKNRQEQLYATHLSRLELYSTYVGISWVLAIVAQAVAVLGLWIVQIGNKSALSFADLMKPGLAWIPAILFILAILAILSSFVPRFDAIVWVYVGFTFFMSYIGNIVKFPNWVYNLNIFHHIMKGVSGTIQPNTPNWGNIWLILMLSLMMVVIGFIGYRRRDLIGE